MTLERKCGRAQIEREVALDGDSVGHTCQLNDCVEDPQPGSSADRYSN
jgi:hypothetical protein